MTDFLEKINQLDIEINNQKVHEQTKEVRSILLSVEQQKVLKTAPNHLGFYPDEQEELEMQENKEKHSKIKTINQLFNSLRQYISINYGIWSLPNLKTATLIKKEFAVDSALEIMAGNAYWSKALNEAGIRTMATDSLEWARTSNTGSHFLVPVHDFEATKAIEKFKKVDLIICSWAPNFNQSDIAAVKAWQKFNPTSRLLFIGEQRGATNSPAFWKYQHFAHSPQLKRVNKSFVSFDFINEQIFEIEHEI